MFLVIKYLGVNTSVNKKQEIMQRWSPMNISRIIGAPKECLLKLYENIENFH